jgi:purine-nucleoside phosphorylase
MVGDKRAAMLAFLFARTAVEMEAAALYAFSRATGAAVLCLAHVTNTMGQTGEDFEKGEADGTTGALGVLEAITVAAKIA